jgi:hypothetical protein
MNALKLKNNGTLDSTIEQFATIYSKQYTINSIRLTCIMKSNELENIPNGSKVLFIVENKDIEEFDIIYNILDVKSDIEHNVRTFGNKNGKRVHKRKAYIVNK